MLLALLVVKMNFGVQVPEKMLFDHVGGRKVVIEEAVNQVLMTTLPQVCARSLINHRLFRVTRFTQQEQLRFRR